MSDQRNQAQKQNKQDTPLYRREIRQDALKKVARLLSDYYQSINEDIHPNELKTEILNKVKEFDKIAGQEARDEKDYSAMMTNQINMFQDSLLNKRREISSGTDPLMMATVMINYLPKLQDFAEHTVFLKNDEKIIQQLIQFIKSIPSNNYGVHINKSDQIDAVKQYYEKIIYSNSKNN